MWTFPVDSHNVSISRHPRAGTSEESSHLWHLLNGAESICWCVRHAQLHRIDFRGVGIEFEAKCSVNTGRWHSDNWFDVSNASGRSTRTKSDDGDISSWIEFGTLFAWCLCPDEVEGLRCWERQLDSAGCAFFHDIHRECEWTFDDIILHIHEVLLILCSGECLRCLSWYLVRYQKQRWDICSLCAAPSSVDEES